MTDPKSTWHEQAYATLLKLLYKQLRELRQERDEALAKAFELERENRELKQKLERNRN